MKYGSVVHGFQFYDGNTRLNSKDAKPVVVALGRETAMIVEGDYPYIVFRDELYAALVRKADSQKYNANFDSVAHAHRCEFMVQLWYRPKASYRGRRGALRGPGSRCRVGVAWNRDNRILDIGCLEFADDQASAFMQWVEDITSDRF